MLLLIQLFRDVFYVRLDLPLTMETLMLFRLLVKMVNALVLMLNLHTVVPLVITGIHYQTKIENVLLQELVLVLINTQLMELLLLQKLQPIVINVLQETQ